MSTPHDPSRPSERDNKPVHPASDPAHPPVGPGGGGGRSFRPHRGTVIAVVAVIALVAAIVTFFSTGDSRRASGDIDRDAARQLCAEGNMIACDDLLFVAPQGSEDQDFAMTCGDRRGGAVGGLALFGRQMMIGGSCEEWGSRR
jgi:hypothetical protein